MVLVETPAAAQNFKAPDFTLKDPSGQAYSLGSVRGPSGLVVAFICNHCPYVKAVITAFVNDMRKARDLGFGVVAIMPNDYQAYPDDAPEKMMAFAAQHNMDFPYLVDESQSVAIAYDAVCTPDFYVFNKDLILNYRGRIYENPMSPPLDPSPDLLHAIIKIAEDQKGPSKQYPSLGCSIKWRDPDRENPPYI